MANLTQTPAQVQTDLDAVEASNVGLDSLTDGSDTQATALKKSGFFGLGASTTDAPTTDRAVMLTIARDVDAVGEIRHAQVVITEPGNAYFTVDDGGTLGTWSQIATTAGSQTLTNKVLTSPDINTPDIDGGTIDGTVIGGSSAAAVSATTLNASGATTLSSTLGVTGQASIADLKIPTSVSRPAAWDTNTFIWAEAGVGGHIDSFSLGLYTGASETRAAYFDASGNTTLDGTLGVTGATTLTGGISGNPEINNGNLIIGTSGKGIDFSATADATGMTAELLDDYEEGLITAVATVGGGTLTVSTTYDQLTYTKIGRKVTITGTILFAVSTSPTGTLRIGPLPFACANTSELGGEAAGSVTITGLVTALDGYATVKITELETVMKILEGGTTGTGDDMAPHIDLGTEMIFSVTYITDS